MDVINLTPHNIDIYSAEPGVNLVILSIPTSGDLRVGYVKDEKDITEKTEIMVNDVMVTVNKFRPYELLVGDKDEYHGKNVIVSAFVAQFLLQSHMRKNFGKIYTPDSNPKSCIRDAKGNIIGVKGLIEYC